MANSQLCVIFVIYAIYELFFIRCWNNSDPVFRKFCHFLPEQKLLYTEMVKSGIIKLASYKYCFFFSPFISFMRTFFHKNRSAVGFHWNANIHIYYIASYSNFGESGTGKCPHFHGSGNTYVYFFMLHTMTIQQAGRSCYGTNNDILTAAGLPVLPYEGKLWMLTKLSRWGLAILSHTHIFVKYKKN